MKTPEPFDYKGYKIIPYIRGSYFTGVIGGMVYNEQGERVGSYGSIQAAQRAVTDTINEITNFGEGADDSGDL